jgi:hypothetical protein
MTMNHSNQKKNWNRQKNEYDYNKVRDEILNEQIDHEEQFENQKDFAMNSMEIF